MDDITKQNINDFVDIRGGQLLYNEPISIENTDTLKLEFIKQDKLTLILFCNFVIGLKEMKTIQQVVQEQYYDNVILIVEKITSFAQKELAQFDCETFEIFHLDEIRINPTKYFLVPKHKILSSEEQKEFFDTHPTYTPTALPKIKTTDPVMKWLGAKKGQLIQITRKSPNTIVSVYYRIVV